MPTRVLLLRHGEAVNPDIFHGAESDVGLSDRGRRQAEAAARALTSFDPAFVVSSAMRRALETALPIAAACGVELVVEPELHERRVGALAGTPTRGRDGVWPDTLARWVAGDTSYAPDGAESFDDIRGRVLPVWERIAADRPGRTRVVVAHGIVIKVLLLSILPGYSIGDWKRLGSIGNVGVCELVGENCAWTAVRLNDPPHQD
jgi:broad specificity phosphatase PhoE